MSLRFLVYWSLRSDALCSDANRNICDEATRIDLERLNPATDELEVETVVEPCADCPRARLEREVQTSAAGQLLQRILDLDFMIEAHIPVDDLSLLEFRAIQLLRAERAAWHAEERESEEEEAEFRRQHAGSSPAVPNLVRRQTR